MNFMDRLLVSVIAVLATALTVLVTIALIAITHEIGWFLTVVLVSLTFYFYNKISRERHSK